MICWMFIKPGGGESTRHNGSVDKKLSNFSTDFALSVKRRERIKTNLLKIANFQTKVCHFNMYSPHHSDMALI